MVTAQPVLKQLVLLGGGHAHVHVTKMFGMKPLPGVAVTLISRDIESPYSGMLPGYVAGFYSREECHIDVPRLARFAGATFVHAEATGIDTVNKKVILKDRPPISYDILSVNLGITPKQNPKTQSSLVTPVKPIEKFAVKWESLLQRVVEANENQKFQIAVVGGGAGGVELCLSMQARIKKELNSKNKGVDHISFTLFTSTSVLLPTHTKRVQSICAKLLKERKINVNFSSRVVEIEGSTLKIENGSTFDFNECIWCTQAGAQQWLETTGLALDSGFIAVKDTLESVNTENVFACGDVASVLPYPRPKAGVFAVRQGPPLFENLRRALLGQELLPFKPQSSNLALIGTGDPNECILSRGPFAFISKSNWQMKDWIDRKWMSQYTTLLPFDKMLKPIISIPSVALNDEEAISIVKEASMRCGGCGSKIGQSVLTNVLQQIKPNLVRNENILTGLDTPDDCAVIKVGDQLTCHTVDFFRSNCSDPYIFGIIAANHALSDCHAMGVQAQTALAIAVVPYAKESIVQETLFQMMSGICYSLKESDCALIGGHSCEGIEMALGFAVNGVVSQNKKLLLKSGLQPENLLILTKPIGTGTLFAADMRGKAKGVWISNAIRSMCKSNHSASKILVDNHVTACTDVTGFGLVGHLFEMCKASSVSVELWMDEIPVLEGASECIKQGVFSSLQPQNIRLRRAIKNQQHASTHELFPLLFDPQTAGGLLFGVPPQYSDRCITLLQELGYHQCAVVGKVLSHRIQEDDECISCSF
eukprot:c18952_g1_i2.p1 GENE.c18952_g1_i2~~c18952_g1_i2.p1  ORF type:complete len:811 (+),score=320.10 c18952_g1_i2:145-2433(+)